MCNQYGGNIPGAKGVPDEILHKASISGVSKINVDTDLRLAMTAGIRKAFAEDPSAFDPRKYMIPARDLIKETVKHKIKNVFCSSNKA
ncbi:Fructose-bisphosphate aldolase class 2 [compost metagenome]